MTPRQLRHSSNYQKLKDMGFSNQDATKCKFWSPKAIDLMFTTKVSQPFITLEELKSIGRGWPRNGKK